MKQFLYFITAILSIYLFSGCSSSKNVPFPKVNVNEPVIQIPNDGETKFENIQDSSTLMKVSHKLKGKHQAASMLVIPAMQRTMAEVKKKGYKYFQIVSPMQISNLQGFPINNMHDLGNFLNPQTSMPTHELNLLETRRTLMDNQESQNVVDVPFLIFGTTEFNFLIRLIENPSYDEIVWTVE